MGEAKLIKIEKTKEERKDGQTAQEAHDLDEIEARWE